MIEPVLNEVIDYVNKQNPFEACGFLGLRKGRVRFYPCANGAADPTQDFVIDPYDYRRVSKEADIVGVIHSHPDEIPSPSALDSAACDRLGLPWYIFGKEDRYIKLEPEENILPLIGRPFVFGAYDCYTIVKDYFAELDIHFNPEWEYEWEFWEKGKNYYLDRYEKEGFSVVTDGSLQIHDVIFMALNSNVTNHAGIYVGDFKILHHAPNRLSCRENYNGIWKQIARKIVRHENFR